VFIILKTLKRLMKGLLIIHSQIKTDSNFIN